MSTGPHWSKHYRGIWQERGGNDRLPAWFRVTALAYGLHRANGHALFRKGDKWGGPGDLACLLFSVDGSTGEMIPATRSTVLRAIDNAVGFGLLAPGSNPACLIVPSHAVVYMNGSDAPCTVDHTQARRKHDRTLGQHGAERAAA